VLKACRARRFLIRAFDASGDRIENVTGAWEAEGRSEVTARWCLAIPAFSTDPASDLTGRANRYQRVQGILGRYRRELSRLVPTGAGAGITRLSCRSPASRDDRPDLTHANGFALSAGVPSGLPPSVPEDHETCWAALDYALMVMVPDESHLPRGAVFLQGVPLVVRIIRPGSLVPMRSHLAAP
jgi:hypothetical protein